MTDKLMVNGKELKLSPKAIKEMEDLRKKIDPDGKLEKLDKELRHSPVTLYCLGCGKIISNKFTGGLWSYTHVCEDRFEENKRPITCVIFGSKEGGVMLPSSVVCGYKSFARCEECKNEQEHIEKVLDGCFGEGWRDRKIDNKDVLELRTRALATIIAYSSKQYGEKVLELSKKHPEWKI